MHDVQAQKDAAKAALEAIPAAEDFRVENASGECLITFATDDGETVRVRLSQMMATKLVAGISTWSRSSKLLPAAGNA